MTIKNKTKKCSWFIPILGILLFLLLNGEVQLFSGTLKIKELGKISSEKYTDVFINGNYAYCTNGAGMDILGILNPANPKRIGHYESPGKASAVEVRHNYAFIADELQGLQVVDVSNPANPVQVGNWNSIGTDNDYVSAVFVRGDYTYAVSHRLLVFNTSTASNPVLIGTFEYENPGCMGDPECEGVYPADVCVNSQYAYIVDFTLGLWVVDLSDPSSPQLSSRIYIPTNIYEIQISGNYLYLATGRHGMEVMDISTPSNPITVANYYGPENHDTSGVFISGTRAYVTYGDQIDIVDISSPSAPVQMARYNGCLAEKVFARGNYAYAVNGHKIDFTVLNVSDPYAPFQVGELDNPDNPWNIALKNNYAYLTDHENRVWVIDIADSAKPFIAGKYISSDYEGKIMIKENYAYLTRMYMGNFSYPYGGLKVLNISNPTSPVLVGHCDTLGTPSGIFLSGNYAYISDGEINPLSIMDISNPSAPVNVGNFVQKTPNRGTTDVFVKDKYAYLAYEENGLYILDISTPSNPKLTGKYQQLGDTIKAVTVRDNYAYLSSFYEGLLILDISNPAQPKPVGRFEMGWGLDTPVVLNDNYAYLLSESNGIYVIDISNPTSPSLACKYGDFDTLGWGRDLLIRNNKLYVATHSGFYILEVQPVVSYVTLTVQSTPDLDAPITVTPPDVSQKGNGTTNFTRSYTTGTVVTLTAPSEYLGKNFSMWMVDGVESTTSRSVKVTMNGNHKAKACYEAAAAPVISLNRSQFYFGVKLPVEQGGQTGPQTLLLSNSGGGALHWSAAASQSWLLVEPDSGTGNAEVQVSINALGLSEGTYTGAITISDPAAENSPQTVWVTLIVYNSNSVNLPFGSFDTPLDGAVVQSSIPVTGWALDKIGIDNVKIYRVENNSFIYIGDAFLVEGARPDIETSFPDYPNSYKAGWGYMMLTNSLPDGGNSTFTLIAKAADMEGNVVTLGSKTITADNMHAIRPFGALDTPAQGGTAAGKNFVNYGWALTPQPNMIPVNGSTINVIIDGVVKGHPGYNVFRPDVAALFPGYANSDGAGGYYYLNTTSLKNGLHTIAWIVTDNAGNADGIGSRYFSVMNSGISDRRGEPACSPAFGPCSPSSEEIITVEIKELERVEINLGAEVLAGYLIVGDQLRELPIGSTLDRERGIFYWQPGPGFVGEYGFEFLGKNGKGQYTRKDIVVHIKPMQ